MRSVSKIKKKYGENAFKKWGEKGGNPLIRNFKLKDGKVVRR